MKKNNKIVKLKGKLSACENALDDALQTITGLENRIIGYENTLENVRKSAEFRENLVKKDEAPRISKIKEIIYLQTDRNYQHPLELLPGCVKLDILKPLTQKCIEALIFEIAARRKTDCILILKTENRDDFGLIHLERITKIFGIRLKKVINL